MVNTEKIVRYRAALLKTLRWIKDNPTTFTARGIMTVSALGALVTATGSTTEQAPWLALVAGLGVETMGSILDRIAGGEELSPRLEGELQKLISESQITKFIAGQLSPNTVRSITSEQITAVIDLAVNEQEYALALLLSQTWVQTGILSADMTRHYERLAELLSKLDAKNDEHLDEISQKLDILLNVLKAKSQLQNLNDEVVINVDQRFSLSKRLRYETMTRELQICQEDYLAIESAYLIADAIERNRYKRKLEMLLSNIQKLEADLRAFSST